jgi:hypothetical protein
MNLSFAGFHEEMQKLGVCRPILLLEVVVAARSMSAQQETNWAHQGPESAQ